MKTERLPEDFMRKHLPEAKGAVFAGVPLESMTKDELMACCVCGWQAEVDARKQGQKDLAFMASIGG